MRLWSDTKNWDEDILVTSENLGAAAKSTEIMKIS